MARVTKAEQRVIDYLEQHLAEETAHAEWINGQTPAEEQREMDYLARQPYTLTFEVTIDPDGAEVSCGANSGSWQVIRDDDGGPTAWSVEPSDSNSTRRATWADSLYGGIGVAVQKMLEAQQEGDGL